MNANAAKHAARAAVWRERVRECRSSGLSVKTWCAERGINTGTYYRWEREVLGKEGRGIKRSEEAGRGIRRSGERRGGESRPMFLELPPVGTGSRTMQAAGRIVAEIVKDRCVIRVYEGANEKVIRALWEAVSC